MLKQKTYDWIDKILFLMFAYAHFKDWNSADSDWSLIKNKTQYFIKEYFGGEWLCNSVDIESKMCIAYDW